MSTTNPEPHEFQRLANVDYCAVCFRINGLYIGPGHLIHLSGTEVEKGSFFSKWEKVIKETPLHREPVSPAPPAPEAEGGAPERMWLAQREIYGVNVWIESTSDGIEFMPRAAHEEEILRVQDSIRDYLIQQWDIPDNCIDGVGCDSGDPLDFTKAEIGQAISFLTDAHAAEVATLKEALEMARPIVEDKANGSRVWNRHDARNRLKIIDAALAQIERENSD